jgi:2-methylisocitrate lyase-like PEP mutase family enzyme
MSSKPSKPSLKQLIDSGRFIVAPGVYDMISAKVADAMGFDAIYMTGYGVTASYLGLPDAGLATYTDMLNRAATIAGGTDTPLIADADTGYGGLLNVRHTVRGYESAGVQAIQLEDQEIPKKCGHTPGRRVVPVEDMVQKIKVAVDSRRSESTLIIARTDARTEHGIDAAIDRALAYVEAGADIAFVESPETVGEIEKIGRSIKAPILANMVPGGRTPVVKAQDLKAMGFQIAIYPGLGFSVAAEAVRRAYGYLQANGSTDGMDVPTYGKEQTQTIHELMGFPDVWEFEKKWSV